MRRAWVITLALLAPAFVAAAESSAPFFARVVGVTPSNSLLIETGGKPTQLVLAFISIPIGRQPYADEAHAVLAQTLLGQRVSVRLVGPQEPDFLLGLVYHGTRNINLALVEQGHAWADNFQFNHPQWNRAQHRARTSGLGLFADPEAMHPRRWREQEDQARVIVSTTQQMARDPLLRDVMESFVGHRQEMVFVPIRCIEVWSLWPRSVLAPITTVAGAEFRGYTAIPCPSAGNSPSPQYPVEELP